jgi:hypothetical protein
MLACSFEARLDEILDLMDNVDLAELKDALAEQHDSSVAMV